MKSVATEAASFAKHQQLDSQCMANIAWSFAHLVTRDDQLLMAFSGSKETVLSGKPQEISSFMWAIGKAA